jgi:hypothetical protein
VVVSFIDGGNLEYLEKTTDLSQVTDKLLSYNVLLACKRGYAYNYCYRIKAICPPLLPPERGEGDIMIIWVQFSL